MFLLFFQIRMRNLRLVISLFTICFSLAKQSISQVSQYRLWGTTGAGSNNQSQSYGTIFSVNNDGSDYLTHKKFEPNVEGSVPTGGLIQINSGELYGMTSQGGINGAGIIYKLNSSGVNYTKLFDFASNDGIAPTGNLVQATNGLLYGMTSKGGQFGYGTIFKIAIDGTGFQKLYDFNLPGGIFPTGSLIQASDGLLYGVTLLGGSGGSIFKIDLNGNGFVNIYDFDTINSAPKENLIEGKDGYLYGITLNSGSLFKIKKTGEDFQVMHTFPSSTNFTNLIQIPSSQIIGVAGNILFSINPDGLEYNDIFEFSEFELIKRILLSSDGSLYGVAGGSQADNNVFRIQLNGTGYLKIFQNGQIIDGNNFQTLIESSEGLLFGTANEGGQSNMGSIFKVTKAGTFTKLKDFPQEGSDPQSDLLLASNNFIYGTATRGGAHGYGVLFRINKDGSDYAKLYDFGPVINGVIPISKLFEAPDGYLYGSTQSGGLLQGGVIFKIKLDGTDFQIIYNINSETGSPVGDLVYDSDGFIYGVTSSPVFFPKGSLFKVRPNGSDYQKLADFTQQSSTVGLNPRGIMIDPDGFIYGVTSRGGINNFGSVFKIKKDGSELTKILDLDLIQFNEASKNIPIRASDGKLYGTNFYPQNIYSYNSNGSDIITYPNPNVKEGVVGNLLELPDEFIYGQTFGNIYRFSKVDASYQYFFNDFEKFDLMKSGLIAIKKMPQEINFSVIPSPKNFGDGNFSLTASSSSQLPITFSSSNSTVATISGDQVIIKGAGTVVLTANQAGNASVESASAHQTLIVNKAQQIISFPVIENKTLSDSNFGLIGSSSSGLPILFSTSSENISINSSVVSLVEAGTAVIVANQLGNSNYLPAEQKQQSFCVNPNKPVITSIIIESGKAELSSSNSTGNQWFENGQIKPNITSNKIVVDKNGIYSVQTTLDGCASLVSEDFVFSITGDIDNSQQNEILIYPSYFNNEINIRIVDSNRSKNSIEIMNLIGNIVCKKEVQSNTLETLFLEQLGSGIYIIVINSSHKSLVFKR
jgi:uncharacterized repeat protein (TIGR03803 family)